MGNNEWQTATGGRRRKAGRPAAAPGEHHQAPAAAPNPSSARGPPTERQVQRWCGVVDSAAAELAAAPFWQQLSQQLGQLPIHAATSKLRRMVMYGLGSLEQPGAVHIRYQLALAKLLAGLLPLLAAAEAFDPVFTGLDRVVLAHCSIQVLAHNEGGKRLAHQPTLFFMPHCEATLTNALLDANLAAGTLHNLVVLGNRFSGYQRSWSLPHRAQQVVAVPGQGAAAIERPATMLRLCECGAVQELPVSECSFPVASAFNDMGLHWFPHDWRQRLGADAPQRPLIAGNSCPGVCK